MYQPQTIDAQSLLEMLSKDGSCVLLDVRTETEQQEANLICNHLSIPLHQFDSAHFCESCGIDKNTPVYIICRSGARAHKAAQMLTDYGLPYAYVVDGGWPALERLGGPVEPGERRHDPQFEGKIKSAVQKSLEAFQQKKAS